jgi:hypothetical protein
LNTTDKNLEDSLESIPILENELMWISRVVDESLENHPADPKNEDDNDTK